MVAAGMDILRQQANIAVGKICRFFIFLKKLFRYNIHPMVSALGREYRRHQQFMGGIII
jgi:hypothetical protein